MDQLEDPSDRYHRLFAEMYSDSHYEMRRYFDEHIEGTYFIGVTRATLLAPQEGCHLDFYLGKSLKANFLVAPMARWAARLQKPFSIVGKLP